MTLALDTETTGLDFRHGCRPFCVTVYDGEPGHFVWPVDPETREVHADYRDLEELAQTIVAADELVLHNSKFDATAIRTLIPDLEWPWEKTQDTLVAGHVLASNQPHNLTDMVMHYLGVDMEPREKQLETVVKRCRDYARRHHPTWRIAKEGMPEVPSSGSAGKLWKMDTWLPTCLAMEQTLPADHEYWTVLLRYALPDAEATHHLWGELRKQLEDRGLWKTYRYRMESMRLAYTLEHSGVTVNVGNLEQRRCEFEEEAAEARGVCEYVAESLGHELKLPKNGVNDNLRTFCFDVLKLEPVAGGKKAKTSKPTLDKNAIEFYLGTLPERGKAHTFLRSLKRLRKRSTALAYMEAYERFWVRIDDCFARLHPNLNPTGSDTLRWTSNNPNEQNISKQDDANIRFCFGPAKGREWYSLDARGIEDRLPAYASKEQELIEIFEKADQPPYYGSNHLLRFHTVYPEIWEGELGKVCDEKCCKGKVVDITLVGPHCKKKFAATYYQWCKNGGFAVQYGAVEKADGWGTADKAFHKRGAHRLLKERFSRLDRYNQWCIDYADKHGYIETMPHRDVDPERGYPLMCTRTQWGKVLPTVPLNYRTQGTAMLWTLISMVEVLKLLDEWRRQDGFDGFITMQVHDELVLDFPRRGNPVEDAAREKTRSSAGIRTSNLWRVRKVQETMAAVGDRLVGPGGEGIPIPVGLEYHENNWGEGMSL
jgi:DNA polymerase I-like protein with 3'-5' exonuclease and polymerase domains